ncbi:MAG: peptide deformylase [Longimicrobiales bacterium]|nr:peptide deformylase [Longimicrobiales bacterium]
MALRRIHLLGDPVLRQEAEPVEVFDAALVELAREMFETMYAAEGVGLAAPQIGISRRIFVIDARDPDDPEGARHVVVNPEILELSKETEKAPEGCLSIPGIEEVVERPGRVRLRACDEFGTPFELESTGLLGRALQHETDHLDGILFLDRLTPLKRRMAIRRWQKLRAEE